MVPVLKEKFPELYNLWEQVNIVDFIAKGLLRCIMYASGAQVVREELFERFTQIYGSRTFSVHKELATMD